MLFWLFFGWVLGGGVGVVVIVVGGVFGGFGIWVGDATGEIVFVVVGTVECALVQADAFVFEKFQF